MNAMLNKIPTVYMCNCRINFINVKIRKLERRYEYIMFHFKA